MKKILSFISCVLLAGVAHAVLLVHEDFEGMTIGDNPSGAATNEVGLGVTGWSNILGANGTGYVTNSMGFSGSVDGNNALYISKVSSGGNVSFDTSTVGISTGKMYVSFLFNGSAADLSVASYMQFRRVTPLDFRINPLATGTSDDGVGFAYGGVTYKEDNSGTLMNTGTNYILIAKFEGLGSAGGTVAGWAVSADAFQSITNGGVTETELNAVAYLKASGTDTEDLTLGITDAFTFASGGAAEYTVDEIRIGTALEDVTGVKLTDGLLVHEDFEGMTAGDGIGTIVFEECGTGISDWSSTLGSNGDGWITNSLAFDTYSTGSNALYVTDYSGGSVKFVTSTDGLTNGALYVSFLFNGTAADLAAADFMQLRRNTPNDFRVCPLATGTTDDGLGIAYGGVTYKEDNSDTLMNNGTYLIVAKFDGLGSDGGTCAVWAVDSTAFYGIKDGGISEAELNANAFLQASGTDTELLTLASDDDFIFAFGGEAQYTIDELKMGTSLESVTIPLSTIGPVLSSILSVAPVSGGLIELVVNTTSPVQSYPKSTTDLVGAAWGSVAHSDDGVNDFVVTNLSYSTASGTNQIIYLQADAAEKFFGIGGE